MFKKWENLLLKRILTLLLVMTTKLIDHTGQWYRCFCIDLKNLFQLFKNKNG